MSIPMKATFFMSYTIIFDGWSGIAAEILRLVPLVIFHLKNKFLVKTEKDREVAMDPGSLTFAVCEYSYIFSTGSCVLGTHSFPAALHCCVML